MAIDEFQQIVYYPEKNVEALLRGRIQKMRNTHFIFAGSERRLMNEMFFSNLRPFYQSATPIELNPIALDVYTAFTQQQFRDAGKQIAAETIKYVYDFWEGVTMYVHKTFHDAFAETQTGELCTPDSVLQIMDSYLHQNEKRMLELLSFITEQQKGLLYAISDEGKANGITSSSFVKKHSLRSASAVQSAARRLLEIDMITRQGQTYSISDPLLRIWLERKKSIR